MIKRAKTYTPKKTATYFIDNNVWIMLLHPNQASTRRQKVSKPHYENLLSGILNVGANIVVCSLLLSEYINTSFRIDHKLVERVYPHFKNDFRKSTEYKSSARAISSSIKGQILKVAKIVDDEFQTIQNEFDFSTIENSDFNDIVFYEFCKKNNITMITDDKDFKEFGSDIDIVTENYHLYKS